MGKLINGSIMLLIVLNILAIVLESIESLCLAYDTLFLGFEAFSVAIFTVEYLLRVWSATESPEYNKPLSGRLRFMLTPMALIDLIAIIPFYLSMFLGFDARFLRVVRLLRIFKLSRHLKALDVLMTVVRNEAGSLVAAVFILGVMVVISSGGIYVAERESQVATFSSIPAAMWWAIVTLSTVGYGDVVPATVGGKLFGVLVMVIGVGMAALPAGIIASGFSTEMQRRREAYILKVTKAMQDGEITEEEEHELEEMREDLGLQEEEAENLEEAVILHSPLPVKEKPQICKHCGKPVE
jgi:voltage-gated potassium channel